VTVLVVVCAALVGGFSLDRAFTAAAGDVPAGYQQVVVPPGGTLWQIAVRAAPQSDPREVVGQLERLNHLSGPGLQVGQVLLVPVAR
jgi:LysM repeat protein